MEADKEIQEHKKLAIPRNDKISSLVERHERDWIRCFPNNGFVGCGDSSK